MSPGTVGPRDPWKFASRCPAVEKVSFVILDVLHVCVLRAPK